MANVAEGEPRNSQEWHGSYLDEDGMVADIVAKVKADPVALQRWLDPVSWSPPIMSPHLAALKKQPDHAGCLWHAGRAIRNFYGLWHASNPNTAFDLHEHLETDDFGVVTDPRHPDNFSDRVIERVKAELATLPEEA
ncbi:MULTISPECIES: hypothetical protein [unclassified Bradyrhizobium]|uniref:hypothetical protein n=1 Tax=unclassified Bradyrhizobium TaxID=2631580 RepID=UPI002916420B|nr:MULTISPECIES: hypothetical protein [unclassified Bradyrhizobium]